MTKYIICVPLCNLWFIFLDEDTGFLYTTKEDIKYLQQASDKPVYLGWGDLWKKRQLENKANEFITVVVGMKYGKGLYKKNHNENNYTHPSALNPKDFEAAKQAFLENKKISM